MGSLLLPASLEEPSFFSLLFFWLLLLLFPPLFLPPLGLEPLPRPDCLPEPDPVSCLPPLGDLDLSRLDLELDLLRDLDLDLRDFLAPPLPRFCGFFRGLTIVLLRSSSSLVASNRRDLTKVSPPNSPEDSPSPSVGFPEPLAAALKEGLNKTVAFSLMSSDTSLSQ